MDNWAIQASSKKGHLKIIRLLLENRADCTAMDNEAIRLASKYGHKEVVKLLKKHGAKLPD
jgi:ankyrin repeat protein